MHNLVPKGQKHPSTRPKASVCTQTGPKGLYLICIIYIICILIFVCISCMYLCNHHTTCKCTQKAEMPKHTAQSLYVCSDRPQRPLISSHLISFHLYHCIWRGRVLSNDFKNNHYTHVHVYSNHTLNHTFLFIITSKTHFSHL